MTTIYHYDGETGEYLDASEARVDPIDGNPLVPAHATTDDPPTAGSNQAAVYRNGNWSLVADYRGTIYWTPGGEKHEIDALGVTPPGNAQYTEPGPTLADVKSGKTAEIKQAYQAALATGVDYNGHTFPLTDTIRNSITAEWLRVKQGEPAQHTAMWPVVGEAPITLTDTEIAELGPIARNAFVPLNNKYLTLLTQVAAAQDKAAVDAITW